MITILLQKILAALTQLLGDIKTKLNTIKDNLDNLIVVATASGPIASFTTTLTRPILSCIVDIPESISGTDTVIVTQTGKNLFDKVAVISNKYLVNDGTETNSSTYSITDYIRINGGSQITISGSTISGNAPSICFYDENKTFISGLQHGSYTFPHTYTIPNNAIYFRDSFYSDSINTIQIEVGSTATTFEAYTATTKTVSLPEIVYGGEVDVIGGIITKTYAAEDLGDLTWFLDGDYFYTDSITDIKSGSINCLCESGYTYDAALSVNKTFTVSGSQIRFRDDMYSSTPDFKTAVTGIDFIYELAEADTESITPEVITAINGVNNIFSDSGDVTVEYLKI